jgi:hypothetical protein
MSETALSMHVIHDASETLRANREVNREVVLSPEEHGLHSIAATNSNVRVRHHHLGLPRWLGVIQMHDIE